MKELATPTLLTTEELLALPDQGKYEYELIRGKLRQRPMTRRNFSHSRTTTNIAALLKVWLEQQPDPRATPDWWRVRPF